MSRSLLFALSLFCSLQLSAQIEPECGAVPSAYSIQMMSQSREAVQAHTASFLADQPETTTQIPVQVHIIRRSDGTDGMTTAEWNDVVDNLNTYYVNSNLFFSDCNPPNFIDSDDYFDFVADEDQATIMAEHQVENVMNVYVPGGTLTSFSGGNICGYAYFPWSSTDVIVTRYSCMINGTTFVHEVGHYFGLYHTHGTSNCGSLTDEFVNGSNCATRGDDVCDTPADPNLLGLDCAAYVVDTDCNYFGTAVDANGDAFMPDPTNVMSYSRKDCRSYLSPGQYARVNFYALNSRGYLTCGPVTAPTNDLCSGAIPLQCNTVVSGNTFNASNTDAPASCGTSLNTAPGTWYSIVGNGGDITVSLCDALYDSKIGVFSGPCNDLSCVAGEDDTFGCGQGTEITFASAVGEQYYVYITGYDQSQGSFGLTTSCTVTSVPVTFTLEEVECTPPGDTLLLPITVRDFNDILNFQFSLEMTDSGPATFTDVTFQNLPASPAFAIIDAHNLSFIWDNNTGLSLDNGDTIALVHIAIGPEGDLIDEVLFSDSPTPIYAESGNGQPAEVNTNDVAFSRCNTAAINGQILREDGSPIAGVNVAILQDDMPLEFMTTDASGTYTFNAVLGGNYRIVPTKDLDYLNGVNAGDLSRIQQHLLGVTQLDSPYRFIAADVSVPEALNSGDLSRIRQLILGDIDAFSDVDSWQFVPADFSFPDPDAPTASPFPNSIELDNFQAATDNLDFVAIKSGDVNNEASPEFVSDSVTFLLQSSGLPILGQTYSVGVRAVDFNNMLAAQYTISWDPEVLAFENVSDFAPALEMSSSNYSFNRSDQGQLPWVWYESNPLSVEDSTELFRINFTVVGQVGQTINLCFSQDPTTFYFERSDQQLAGRFGKLNTPVVLASEVARLESIARLQLYPNPASQQFTLSNLPQDGQSLALDLFNATGQLVRQWTTASQTTFPTHNLPAGVYRLRISTAEGSGVKTVVVE